MRRLIVLIVFFLGACGSGYGHYYTSSSEFSSVDPSSLVIFRLDLDRAASGLTVGVEFMNDLNGESVFISSAGYRNTDKMIPIRMPGEDFLYFAIILDPGVIRLRTVTF